MRIEAGGGREKDLELMEHITSFITGKSFCPFGDAAVWGLQSNLAKFRDEFIAYIEQTNPEEVGPHHPDPAHLPARRRQQQRAARQHACDRWAKRR